MLDVVSAARVYLYQDPVLTVIMDPADTVAWCRAAGMQPERWDAWVDYYGPPFVKWFCLQLLPDTLEEYALDALWWRAWRTVLTNDRVSAAHLKTFGEMRGHFDVRPPPPPIEHLTSDEAMEALVGMGVDVLTVALTEALEKESERRGQLPADPTTGGPDGQEEEKEE